ncbi:4Fe-4S_ferredoxin iron-sulfur binding domain protein [Hexamita inflata]|uniref:4Fe-4S ferredoxin iron-sulfur binding domain protein n=1 Tax=Hexamita inflata TaxID=28002 RepID=A0AA86NA75_9EUKA|nr:4Fe-4S ferredoxin iron-sulfur binding domain protein [Hexamita inflata]
MKIGVLVGSTTGNTENFSHLIMDELKKQDTQLQFQEYKINQEMYKKNSQDSYEYPNCDAYMIGSYTDSYNLPIFVRQYLEAMPSELLHNKYVLTFGTYGGNNGHQQYVFEQILSEHGAIPVVHIKCLYPDSFVHAPFIYAKKINIKKQDIVTIPVKCKLFLDTLKSKQFKFVPKSKGCGLGLMNKLQQKRIPIKFVVKDTCVGCGACVENCPSAVFSLKEGKAVVTNEDACVGCYACFQKCPVHAIVDAKKNLENKEQYQFKESLLIDQPKQSNWKLRCFIVIIIAGVVIMITK